MRLIWFSSAIFILILNPSAFKREGSKSLPNLEPLFLVKIGLFIQLICDANKTDPTYRLFGV